MAKPRYFSLPYKKIIYSTESRSEEPHIKLAKLLGRYNVPKHFYIAQYLYKFVKEGNFFSFLDLLYGIAEPADVLPLLAGRAWISNSKTNLSSIRPVISQTPRPIQNCYEDSNFDSVLDLSQRRDRRNLERILVGYYKEEFVPDFDEWLSNPTSIISFLRERGSDIYPVASNLLVGEVYRAVEEIVQLTTGLDLRESYKEEEIMKNIINDSLGIMTPGYE